jgi:hypothetical protein
VQRAISEAPAAHADSMDNAIKGAVLINHMSDDFVSGTWLSDIDFRNVCSY